MRKPFVLGIPAGFIDALFGLTMRCIIYSGMPRDKGWEMTQWFLNLSGHRDNVYFPIVQFREVTKIVLAHIDEVNYRRLDAMRSELESMLRQTEDCPEFLPEDDDPQPTSMSYN